MMLMSLFLTFCAVFAKKPTTRKLLGGQIVVYVIHAGETIPVEVDCDSNVRQLNAAVAEALGKSHLVLSFGGAKLLDDEQLLPDAGIGAEARIEVIEYDIENEVKRQMRGEGNDKIALLAIGKGDSFYFVDYKFATRKAEPCIEPELRKENVWQLKSGDIAGGYWDICPTTLTERRVCASATVHEDGTVTFAKSSAQKVLYLTINHDESKIDWKVHEETEATKFKVIRGTDDPDDEQK